MLSGRPECAGHRTWRDSLRAQRVLDRPEFQGLSAGPSIIAKAANEHLAHRCNAAASDDKRLLTDYSSWESWGTRRGDPGEQRMAHIGRAIRRRSAAVLIAIAATLLVTLTMKLDPALLDRVE